MNLTAPRANKLIPNAPQMYGAKLFISGTRKNAMLSTAVLTTASRTRSIPSVASVAAGRRPSRSVRTASCAASPAIRTGSRLFRPTPSFWTTKSRATETGSSTNSTFQRSALTQLASMKTASDRRISSGETSAIVSPTELQSRPLAASQPRATLIVRPSSTRTTASTLPFMTLPVGRLAGPPVV